MFQILLQLLLFIRSHITLSDSRVIPEQGRYVRLPRILGARIYVQQRSDVQRHDRRTLQIQAPEGSLEPNSLRN
jgi:hypothetical protein